MNKSTKIVAVFGVLALVGGSAFYLYTNTKTFYATKIAKEGKSSNLDVLLTFDKKFLKQWYKAVKNKENTFTLDGKVYNTQGGKLKQ
jgi:hypothetical protein